jgi:hypothetical protein
VDLSGTSHVYYPEIKTLKLAKQNGKLHAKAHTGKGR